MVLHVPVAWPLRISTAGSSCGGVTREQRRVDARQQRRGRPAVSSGVSSARPGTVSAAGSSVAAGWRRLTRRPSTGPAVSSDVEFGASRNGVGGRKQRCGRPAALDPTALNGSAWAAASAAS